jgi:hypothetical protein
MCRIAASIGLVLLAGCGASPQAGVDEDSQMTASQRTSVVPDGPFRTDRSAYVARRVPGVRGNGKYAFTLVAQYVNRTSAPVYLYRCFPDSHQPIYNVHLVGAREPLASAYDPGWGCVGHEDQIVVQPGTIRVHTLRITGPTASERSGETIGKLEGRYRLEYEAQSCPRESGCLLPDSMRFSNEFDVRIQR